MSTLRISNIEAKADSSSPTVDEQLKFTNSDGDLMLYLDGRTAGITTVGINTTNQTIKFDANNNILITGIVTATEFHGSLAVGTSVTYGDNEKAYFGNGLDLELFHDGTNSFIKNTTGNLRIQDSNGNIQIQAKAGEESIIAKSDGAVELYYNNTKRIETTNTGAVVTGIATVTGSSTSTLVIKSTVNNGTPKLLLQDAFSLDNYVKVENADNLVIAADDGNIGTDSYIKFKTDNVERVRIAPDGKLHVGGFIAKSTGGFASVISTGGVSNNGGFQAHYNSGAYGGGSMTTVNAAGGGLDFWTYTGNVGSEAYSRRLRIDSGGRVKIGTTSNKPAADNEPGIVFGDNTAGTATKGIASFCANGAAPLLLTRRVSDGNVLGIADDAGTKGILGVTLNDLVITAIEELRFSTGAGQVERMRLTNAGRFGIGVSGPSSALHVKSSSGTQAVFESTGSDNASISFQDATTTDSIIVGALNNDLQIRCDPGNIVFKVANNTEKLRIDTAGNLLIDATSVGNASTYARNIFISGSSNNGITIHTTDTSGTNRKCCLFFGDGTSVADMAKGMLFYDHNGDYLHMSANGGGTGFLRSARLNSDGTFRLDSNPSTVNSVSLRIQSHKTRTVNDNNGIAFFDEVNHTQAAIFVSKQSTSNGTSDLVFSTSSGQVVSTLQGIPERMRLTSEGYLTKPATPAFFATHGGNSASGSTGYITYNTAGAYYNNGSHFNTSNGRFTAPVTGIYHFHFHCFVHNTATQTNIEIILRRFNSGGGGQTSLTRGFDNKVNGNYGPAVALAWTGPLTAGQYVQIYSYNELHHANGYYFGGYLIG